MVSLPRLKTTFIVGLCVMFLSGQWGCATPSGKSPSGIQAQLGTIAVVPARYTPAFEFELPAKGWLGGAGRGAVGGAKAFIVLVPSAAVVGGVSAGAMCCTFGALFAHGFLGALWTVAALVKGAGYMIVGPFYGAATAEAPATVEEAEAPIKASPASVRIQETMREHVVQAAQSLAHVDLTVLDGQGPESASDLLTYFPLQGPPIDSVLELRVNRVWLSTNESFFTPVTNMIPSNEVEMKPSQVFKPNMSQELQINSPLSLGMEVRGRLIRTADKVVLFDNTWKHEGGSYLFTEWAANDAQLFAEEFERAYDELARQLVTGIF